MHTSLRRFAAAAGASSRDATRGGTKGSAARRGTITDPGPRLAGVPRAGVKNHLISTKRRIYIAGVAAILMLRVSSIRTARLMSAIAFLAPDLRLAREGKREESCNIYRRT